MKIAITFLVALTAGFYIGRTSVKPKADYTAFTLAIQNQQIALDTLLLNEKCFELLGLRYDRERNQSYRPAKGHSLDKKGQVNP